MTSRIGRAALAMTLACCTPLLAQQTDTYLAAVEYDVYLNKENPLYAFGVGHPCGTVVTLQANKLPMNVQGVELLWAYELDATGRTRTKWPLPVDATPLAIDGDRLIIHQFNAEEVVIVTREGEIGTALFDPPKAPPLESKARNLVTCPEGIADDSLCARLVDNSTGAVRIIEYPSACT
jgi:hypothetical protein